MNNAELHRLILRLGDESQLLNLLNRIKMEMLGGKFEFRKSLSEYCKLDYYKEFAIGKRRGGYRKIYSPKDDLKFLQLCLKKMFDLQYIPMPFSFGFVMGRSVVDNALCHTNKEYVYNIDIKNFFSSITYGMIYECLRLPPFNYNESVANIIARLCTIKDDNKGFLPQGAPTSPLLSNAVCNRMDMELMLLAIKYDAQYSRYADDITFSANNNVFGLDSQFRKELVSIINFYGFEINKKKERLQPKSTRQIVTGLVVNDKVNVRRKYIKDISAILHIWDKYGYDEAYKAFKRQYDHAIFLGYTTGYPDMKNSLSGKLSYLRMIRGDQDREVLKLTSLLKLLIKRTIQESETR